MNIEIKKSKLSGIYNAKPSKSFSHRYLIAAMLSNNECTISNVDFSEDINATLSSIESYGKKITIDKNSELVYFKQGTCTSTNPIFNCNESGTTLRLFFPIALSKYNSTKFIGSERLIERGVNVYENVLNYIKYDKSQSSISTNGILKQGNYNLPGNISSQYISGLLYALPLLNGDSKITITTKVESLNYVLMTLNVLNNFNIKIYTNLFDIIKNDPNLLCYKNMYDSICANKNNLSFDDEHIEFHIEGNQKYIAHNYFVEGDYSNTAFIDAFNYFNSDIKIIGLNEKSLQSDKIYKKYFDELSNGFTTIDISNSIDLGPIVMVFAALKNGAKLINTKRLKIKESDRGNAIAAELKKCNADINVFDNEIIINKSDLSAPKDMLFSHNDHRIAMALSLLSTKFDLKINDAECVKKSYPSFFYDLENLGANIGRQYE